MSSNPSNCCGVKTDGCSNPIPDVLHVTIHTPCGASGGPVALDPVYNGPLVYKWKGSVPAKCLWPDYYPEECGPLSSLNVEIEYSEDIWRIRMDQEEQGAFVTCDPFVLNAEFISFQCDVLVQDVEVTVTE